MAVVLLFLICAGILVLQGSLFPLLWPLAYQPDPLLVLVISLSILLGEKRGSLVGLAAGLLQDILFGPALGLYGLSKAATAFLAGFAAREIYKDQIIGPLILTFILTVMHEFMVFAMINLFFYVNTSWEFFASPLLLKSFGNIAFLFILYPVTYNAGKRGGLFPRDIRL
jgi:rod shape-determining protein MreD